MKKKLTRISAFCGRYEPFSNSYPCLVEYEGMTFPSAEHAFQAAKTTDRIERMSFAVCPTAKEVKELGQKIRLRTDWEEIKVQVMTEVVREKFVRNQSDKDLRKLLLWTGDAHLEEDNSHGDRFWGTVKGEGENWLGKILMQVRKELRWQEETRKQLIESWNRLLDDLYSWKKTLKLETFQTLFLDTWKYLSERCKVSAFSCSDTALTNRLACFAAYGECPESLKPWEFETCCKFAEGILQSISQMESRSEDIRIAEGVILVEGYYYRDTRVVKICDFQKSFAEICDIFRSEGYPDEIYDDEE